MKKAIAMFVLFGFVLTVASASFARTLEEEKQAVRDYLKVVDAKIVKFRKAGQKAKVAAMQGEKAVTLKRWEALKAQMETAVAPAPAPWTPPAPAPVAKAPVVAEPTSAPVVSKAMGIDLTGKVGLVAGTLGYSINDILPGTKVVVGGSYVAGSNTTNSVDFKAVNLSLGATYAVTEWMTWSGIPGSWYVGGNFLLPVKVSASRTGKWGVEAVVGYNYMVPDFGTIVAELGYAGLKYSDTDPAQKGVNLSVGYAYGF